MDVDLERIKYILHASLFDIERQIDNVLEDSEEDPQYSAVTATNLIKCYIVIMEQIGEELSCSNVKDFFEYIGYSEQEYFLFEKKRRKESVYYIGVQY